MPETAQRQRKPSQPARKSIDGRKNEAKQGCKGSDRADKKSPAVIAGSFLSLKVAEKPGIAVHIAFDKDKKRNKWETPDDYVKMYKDLLKCLHHSLNLVGAPSNFDPLASGMDLSQSIYYVTNCFKNNVLPKDFNFNIEFDEEDKEYFFTIYKECDCHSYWHAFEIKPVADTIAADKNLHSFFLQVMTCLNLKAGINTWWDGGLGYADYMFYENLSNFNENYPEDDDEEEEFERMEVFNAILATHRSYTTGDAKRYEQLFKNTEYSAPIHLEKKIQKFDQSKPVVIWLKSAIEFLHYNGCISDFTYESEQDGLKYDQQVTIIYDFTDEMTSLESECIDSEANGVGLHSPVLNLAITPNLKEIDFDDMKERAKWPLKLSKLYGSYQDLTNSFTDKNDDKRQNGYFA